MDVLVGATVLIAILIKDVGRGGQGEDFKSSIRTGRLILTDFVPEDGGFLLPGQVQVSLASSNPRVVLQDHRALVTEGDRAIVMELARGHMVFVRLAVGAWRAGVLRQAVLLCLRVAMGADESFDEDVAQPSNCVALKRSVLSPTIGMVTCGSCLVLSKQAFCFLLLTRK